MKNRIHLVTCFCLALLVFRIFYSNTIHYAFLIWNLFLAWIPYLLSKRLATNIGLSKAKSLVLFLTSIAFLPNAVYLLTDFVHLRPRHEMNYWYDIVLVFSFASAGLIYSIATFRYIENRLVAYSSHFISRIVLFILFFASGYGVYMGRILRWNSWDIILHPLEILSDTIQVILHPLQNEQAWLITILFSMIQFLSWFLSQKSIPNQKL